MEIVYIVVSIIIASLAFAIFLQPQKTYMKRMPPDAGDAKVEGSTYIKPDWYDQLREELNRLPLGKYAFNPPSEMKLGFTERVELRLTQNPGEELTRNLKGRGVPEVDTLKVGSLMKARLSGTAFSVSPMNEEEQLVPEAGHTEWAWDVMPLKSGTQKLHLHITIRIRLPFGEERKDHPVVDREIDVHVNPLYSIKVFFSRYWKWIVTAIVLPVVWWLIKKYFGGGP